MSTLSQLPPLEIEMYEVLTGRPNGSLVSCTSETGRLRRRIERLSDPDHRVRTLLLFPMFPIRIQYKTHLCGLTKPFPSTCNDNVESPDFASGPTRSQRPCTGPQPWPCHTSGLDGCLGLTGPIGERLRLCPFCANPRTERPRQSYSLRDDHSSGPEDPIMHKF